MAKDLILITDKVCDHLGYLTDAWYYEFINIARSEFMKVNNIDSNILEYTEFNLEILKHVRVGDKIFITIENTSEQHKVIFREFIYNQANDLMVSCTSFFTQKAK